LVLWGPEEREREKREWWWRGKYVIIQGRQLERACLP